MIISRLNSQNNILLQFSRTSVYLRKFFYFTFMFIFLGILLTLFVFTIVVFIHEMWHFLTARFTGMKVLEFGIGIPPKAKTLGLDKKGTEYTLNWLPIGGFVRINWEDPGSEEAKDRDAFSSKKWWARSLVLVAWVTMNFLLAFFVFFGLLFSGSHPLGPNSFTQKDYHSYFLPSLQDSLDSGYVSQSGITISAVTWSVAMAAWIGNEEYIKSANGVMIHTLDDLGKIVQDATKVSLILSNSGIERTVTVTPKDGKIGVMVWYGNLKIEKQYAKKFSFLESLHQAGWETYTLSRLTFDLIVTTFKNILFPSTPTARKEASEMLSGPIGMTAWFTQIIESGITWNIFFLIIAMLSLNLWVLNILPFPALDGGRLFSTTIMAFISLFTKKNKLLITIERSVHSFGMIFLIIVSIIIACMDIIKL